MVTTRRSAAAAGGEPAAEAKAEAKAQAKAQKSEAGKVPNLREEISLADFVTLCNAVCGTSIVFLCLNYLENDKEQRYIATAFALFPIGLFCDIIDGWVARRRYSSVFGGDMDSLADLVSFGVAPATMGFTLGLRGFWDSVCLVIFVVCGLCRLARYNASVDIISEGTGKVKYYEGMPIPGSLVIVLVLFFAWYAGVCDDENIFGGKHDVYPGHFRPFSLLYLACGLLMISLVRFPKP